MRKLKKTCFYLVLILALVACGTDDDGLIDSDDLDFEESDGRITAMVNGDSFVSSEFVDSVGASFGTFDLENSQGYAFAITGVQIASNSGKAIVLSFGDDDINTLLAGKEHNGMTDEMSFNFAYGGYGEEGSTEVNATSEGTTNATVIVTSIDMSTKTVSGTFIFTAVDEETGQSYSVTDGVFTNIKYDDN